MAPYDDFVHAWADDAVAWQTFVDAVRVRQRTASDEAKATAAHSDGMVSTPVPRLSLRVVAENVSTTTDSNGVLLAEVLSSAWPTLNGVAAPGDPPARSLGGSRLKVIVATSWYHSRRAAMYARRALRTAGVVNVDVYRSYDPTDAALSFSSIGDGHIPRRLLGFDAEWVVPRSWLIECNASLVPADEDHCPLCAFSAASAGPAALPARTPATKIRFSLRFPCGREKTWIATPLAIHRFLPLELMRIGLQLKLSLGMWLNHARATLLSVDSVSVARECAAIVHNLIVSRCSLWGDQW